MTVKMVCHLMLSKNGAVKRAYRELEIKTPTGVTLA